MNLIALGHFLCTYTLTQRETCLLLIAPGEALREQRANMCRGQTVVLSNMLL